MAAIFSDATLNEQVSTGTVLIDFWAPWCGPCRTMGPIIDRLAVQFAGRATVGKLDVDENSASADRFGVSSIPMLVILQDGQEVFRHNGLMPENKLAAHLEKFV